MVRRSMQWVNTPVLMEALDRYEQGRLPRSMRLWVEAVLELERPLTCLLYTSPSPRDRQKSRMPSSA